MFKKTLSLTVIACFLLTTVVPLPHAHADSILDLPAPGTMVNLSPAYEPVIIKGLTVHKDNPFLFDFLVDVGQDKMSGAPLKKEGEKLIKYFLAGLAIPDKDLWVNLSPYEKTRMVPEALGQTDMGRDLLEEDYILKQITASLIYPEKKLGKTFWDEVYAKAQEMYGTSQIPVNTFNKVWIMADRAEVFERNQTAFVVGRHLKVMLEEDYLALQKHNGANSTSSVSGAIASEGKQSHTIGSQIIRQIILPELEKEVNTGKNFANLRQIFNSVILSAWYKKNLKEALLNQVYAGQSKVKGINLNDPAIKQQIYEQYLKAYKKGVFNYIKEDVNNAGDRVPRKYFSGGTVLKMNPDVITDPAMGSRRMAAPDFNNGNDVVDFATLASTNRGVPQTNAAMTVKDLTQEEREDLLQDLREHNPNGIEVHADIDEIGHSKKTIKLFPYEVDLGLRDGTIRAVTIDGNPPQLFFTATLEPYEPQEDPTILPFRTVGVADQIIRHVDAPEYVRYLKGVSPGSRIQVYRDYKLFTVMSLEEVRADLISGSLQAVRLEQSYDVSFNRSPGLVSPEEREARKQIKIVFTSMVHRIESRSEVTGRILPGESGGAWVTDRRSSGGSYLWEIWLDLSHLFPKVNCQRYTEGGEGTGGWIKDEGKAVKINPNSTYIESGWSFKVDWGWGGQNRITIQNLSYGSSGIEVGFNGSRNNKGVQILSMIEDMSRRTPSKVIPIMYNGAGFPVTPYHTYGRGEAGRLEAYWKIHKIDPEQNAFSLTYENGWIDVRGPSRPQDTHNAAMLTKEELAGLAQVELVPGEGGVFHPELQAAQRRYAEELRQVSLTSPWQGLANLLAKSGYYEMKDYRFLMPSHERRNVLSNERLRTIARGAQAWMLQQPEASLAIIRRERREALVLIGQIASDNWRSVTYSFSNIVSALAAYSDEAMTIDNLNEYSGLPKGKVEQIVLERSHELGDRMEDLSLRIRSGQIPNWLGYEELELKDKRLSEIYAALFNSELPDDQRVVIIEEDGKFKVVPDNAALAKIPQVVTHPWTNGGIDLNTTNGMQWKDSKDGVGVVMKVDPVLIARVRQEGIHWLSPVVLKMTRIESVWSLAGLPSPAQI